MILIDKLRLKKLKRGYNTNNDSIKKGKEFTRGTDGIPREPSINIEQSSKLGRRGDVPSTTTVPIGETDDSVGEPSTNAEKFREFFKSKTRK